MRRITLVAFLLLLIFNPVIATAWTESATFEGIADGVVADDNGVVAFSYAGSATTISSTVAKSGSKSAALLWPTGSDGWAITHGNLEWIADIGEGGEVWYRSYAYYQPGWLWADTFKKHMRIGINNSSAVSEGWISIILHNNGEILLSNEVDPLLAAEQFSGVFVESGTWVCMEIYVYLSSTSGIVRIWKNGVLAHEQTGYKTLGASDSVAARSIYASSWNAPYSPQIQTEYVDDIILTTDQPSNVDSAGNKMIGPIGWGATTHGWTSSGVSYQ